MRDPRVLLLLCGVMVAIAFLGTPPRATAACGVRGRAPVRTVLARLKGFVAGRRPGCQVESRCCGDACQAPAVTAASPVALPPPPR